MGGFLGLLVGLILVLYLHGRRSMDRQLRRALNKHVIRLDYQPIYDLRTGKLVAAEALARWPRKDGVVWTPDVFLPVAEQRKFIGDFTRYVVRHVLSDLGDVMASGSLRVNINITGHDLADETFPEFLERTLAAENVPAQALGVELTERSTANHVTAIASIERLRRSGHAVYIDDFGTGYSSLAYLHQLSVDAIKIDRSFTQTLGTGAATASVVPQILSMAKTLDLAIVVEGLETPEQVAYFSGEESRILGQGWYFGRPMPPALLRELVAKMAAGAVTNVPRKKDEDGEVTGGWFG
jgi:sensor c-di-GMP phosphodiesterase-like protein